VVCYTPRSIILAIDEILKAPDVELADGQEGLQDDPTLIVGTAAAKGKATGKVRMLADASDAALVEAGDIVVTKYPSSLINLVLGKAGGIVTDFGGMLCHAAICAREYEIPSVVGTLSGTKRLKNGDMVEVDGTNGRLRILN
jgi:pyruvate,water dikinase